MDVVGGPVLVGAVEHGRAVGAAGRRGGGGGGRGGARAGRGAVGADVQCDGLAGRDGGGELAVPAHGVGGAGAAAAGGRVTVLDVAVGAGRQRGLEGLRHRARLAVDGDVALAAAAEADRVVAVGPPVGDTGAGDRVAEADHVGDLAPRVGAVPAVAVAGVDGAAVRRAVVVAGEGVAGVDVRRAVRVGQHEHVGQRVGVAVLVVEGRAVALGVPVVDEGAGLRAAQQAVAPAGQVGDLAAVEGALQPGRGAELVHVAGAGVLGRLDGLAAAVDDLLHPVGARVAHLRLDGGQVGGGHVLGRVDPEAVDAHAGHVAQVVGDGLLDVRAAGVEVGEVDQLAVLDVAAVAVVADRGAAGVEVLVPEVAGVVVLAVVRAAGAGAGAGRHVVDHRVGDHLHARRVAGVDHVLEGRPVAEAPGDLVADRLVGGPPLRALDVLLGRGDLDEAVALRAERVGTGLGDGVEAPLEEGGGDVLAAGRGGLRAGGDGQCGADRERERRRGGERSGDACAPTGGGVGDHDVSWGLRWQPGAVRDAGSADDGGQGPLAKAC